MPKSITFANLNDATNEELYEFIQATGKTLGFYEADPVKAQLAIDQKVADCEAYCMNTELVRKEYARFKDCNYEELDPAMMFCNTSVLAVLHRHVVGDDLPDPTTVIAAYKQELESDYHERLKHVVYEILKMDVPESDRVQLDLLAMREADEHLNVYLEQFVRLLEAIDQNDYEIDKALATGPIIDVRPPSYQQRIEIDRERIKKTKFNDPEVELLRVAEDLKEKYAYAYLAQDEAALKILYEQLRQQNELLDRLGKPRGEMPARPRPLLYDLSIDQHMARLNRILHTRDKIRLSDTKVRTLFTRDINSRQKMMRQWEQEVRKRMPTKVTHLFRDVQKVTGETRADIDQALTKSLNQIASAATATKEMLVAAQDNVGENMDAAIASCDRIVQDASDIAADVKDISNEIWYNPVTAVMKIIALARNLWQIYSDTSDYVKEKTNRVTDKFTAAQQKAERLFKPLINMVNSLVEKIADLIPAIRKYRMETQAGELRSSKRKRKG